MTLLAVEEYKMAAARLISKSSRVTAYLPNLSAAVKHFRTFSSYSDKDHFVTLCSDENNYDHTVWPNELGPFGPQDRRFTLPGNVGVGSKIRKPAEKANTDILFENLPEERQMQLFQQVEQTVQQMENQFLPEPSAADNLECIAQDCPHILRKDFQELFPSKDMLSSHLTIITISNKTNNDMTGWSIEVEEEREQLLDAFIEGATEICNALYQAGFWADFIDPSCGKPFLSPHTNATMFETDERYKKLGFEIDDLGCCKVIRHHIWGTHSYIGCLFTSAPLDHPIISAMVQES